MDLHSSSEYWKNERKAYQKRMADYEVDQKRKEEERTNQQQQSAMCTGTRNNRFTGAYQDPPRPEWLSDLRQLERRVEAQQKQIEVLEQIILSQRIEEWQDLIQPDYLSNLKKG
jgi:hypothetical protein